MINESTTQQVKCCHTHRRTKGHEKPEIQIKYPDGLFLNKQTKKKVFRNILHLLWEINESFQEKQKFLHMLMLSPKKMHQSKESFHRI